MCGSGEILEGILLLWGKGQRKKLPGCLFTNIPERQGSRKSLCQYLQVSSLKIIDICPEECHEKKKKSLTWKKRGIYLFRSYFSCGCCSHVFLALSCDLKYEVVKDSLLWSQEILSVFLLFYRDISLLIYVDAFLFFILKTDC